MRRAWRALGPLLRVGTRAVGPSAAPVVVDADHGAVFEVGWEGDWARSEGWHHGLTFACEVTPVERWLELEFGASLIHAANGTEIPIDLLFKKPWTLGHGVEFMA